MLHFWFLCWLYSWPLGFILGPVSNIISVSKYSKSILVFKNKWSHNDVAMEIFVYESVWKGFWCVLLQRVKLFSLDQQFSITNTDSGIYKSPKSKEGS